MDILAWIVVGLIAGVIANMIYPAPEKGGILGAIVLGIVGAIVGGWVAGFFLGADVVNGLNVVSIIVSVIGALILLVVYHALVPSRRSI